MGPPPHLPPGFSWALPGSIRQYSGACLQPIPPLGPLSCILRETKVANLAWLLGGTGVVQRLGKFPLAPFPLPGPHAAPLAFWGPLWCWIPTNLGLLEVSIPVRSVAFPLSLMFKTFTISRQPFPLCHHTLPPALRPAPYRTQQWPEAQL